MKKTDIEAIHDASDKIEELFKQISEISGIYNSKGGCSEAMKGCLADLTNFMRASYRKAKLAALTSEDERIDKS